MQPAGNVSLSVPIASVTHFLFAAGKHARPTGPHLSGKLLPLVGADELAFGDDVPFHRFQ